MTAKPLVSVIVPVKNGERFLAQALSDIERQTYERREVIVVDGRSTDRSPEIARSFGVRLLEQPGDGFADAWNIGIRAATGDLIAFLDSDDRWHADKLTAQVELLERRPDVDYVVTRARFFLEPGHPCPPGFRPALLEGDHVAMMPSALLARRAVFDTVGDFRTDFGVASDVDWFARVKDAQLVRAVVQKPLVSKRLHDTNLSFFAARGMNHDLLRLLRESVERTRT